jgi:hypothetical protein
MMGIALPAVLFHGTLTPSSLMPTPNQSGLTSFRSSTRISTHHASRILPRAIAKSVRRALALCAVAFLPGFPTSFAPGPLGTQTAGSAEAQSSFSQGTELDEILLVQAPENDNGSGGIVLAWVPEPLQQSCLGRTLSQCAAMDFCIRTTTKTVPMCRNLAIPLSRLPSYPRGMTPPRVMSLSFYKLTPGGPYQPLVDIYKSLPSSSLDRLSMDARIKARIRYTHSGNNDSMQMEQVLSTAPF